MILLTTNHPIQCVSAPFNQSKSIWHITPDLFISLAFLVFLKYMSLKGFHHQVENHLIQTNRHLFWFGGLKKKPPCGRHSLISPYTLKLRVSDELSRHHKLYFAWTKIRFPIAPNVSIFFLHLPEMYDKPIWYRYIIPVPFSAYGIHQNIHPKDSKISWYLSISGGFSPPKSVSFLPPYADPLPPKKRTSQQRRLGFFFFRGSRGREPIVIPVSFQSLIPVLLLYFKDFLEGKGVKLAPFFACHWFVWGQMI